MLALDCYLEKLHYWSDQEAEVDEKFGIILTKVSQALIFSLGKFLLQKLILCGKAGAFI